MLAEDYKNGQILLIDKPLHWTSFQAVNKVRWALRKKFGLKKIKVGHAGTLDPLATGLLVLCTGKFTKKIQQLQAETKEYTGTIILGATTPSFDLETAIDRTYPIDHISEKMILEGAASLTGRIMQIPPMYSAIKKDGVRLYEKARKGEQAQIKPREVEITTFEITGIRLPEVHFRITCSKGTYIRSIASDLGKALGSGAYLSALRRTKSGGFDVSNALSPEEFTSSLED